jgi:hypothetical protein
VEVENAMALAFAREDVKGLTRKIAREVSEREHQVQCTELTLL